MEQITIYPNTQMKIIAKLSLIIIITLNITWCKGQNTNNDSTKLKVAELLASMSIEEKVGEMTQLTLGTFYTNDTLDLEKLRNAIVNHHVGSILNVHKDPLTPKAWGNLIKTIQDIALYETPHKIPVLYGIDAIHGANYTVGATLFPHNIAMAATRNTALPKKAAKITAMEVRASGIRWNFDPTLGVGRQPLWSRFEETYGEDPYLAAAMGGAAVAGYEEDGLQNPKAVASCMKHFIGYAVPLSGKDRTPAYIPLTQLKELYLPPFVAAVKNGTSTVMINSGEINGVPVHGSSFYLKDLLRNELGFKGLAVTDWQDIIRLHTRHKIAPTLKDAVKIAVNAGIDMSMVPKDYDFCNYLIELVKEGEVPEARIDEAVGRILKLKIDLGLFDNPYTEADALKNFGKPEYKAIALDAALESITLLKNDDNILPLSKSSKILLMGPTAHNNGSLHGSWSYTWQGFDESYYPNSSKTLKDAFEMVLGTQNVISNSTNTYNDIQNTDIPFLQKHAKHVDAIILCLGEKAYAESPGSISDLNLEQNQLDLAKAAYSTGKPVILLLAQGRPRIISQIVNGAKGIIQLYRPASEGALATTKIVFGDADPSGVLPFSYPRHAGDIVPYDRKGTDEITEYLPDVYSTGAYQPQWPFGFGLSYTTFDFGHIKLDKQILNASETLNLEIPVTNTGKRAGKVAIDLFVTDHYASVTPSLLKLKRFIKIELQPNETQVVTFKLTPDDLSFIDAKGYRIIEPGTFSITIGDKKVDFAYR